jgi:hypothetical protein
VEVDVVLVVVSVEVVLVVVSVEVLVVVPVEVLVVVSVEVVLVVVLVIEVVLWVELVLVVMPVMIVVVLPLPPAPASEQVPSSVQSDAVFAHPTSCTTAAPASSMAGPNTQMSLLTSPLVA